MYSHVGIDIAPKTQHTNLSELATFHCRATGVNTFWNIDNITYHTNNNTEDGYTFGEVLVGTENGIGVHDLYLQVPATSENNGTQVQCLTIDSAHILSKVVSLIVQGKYGQWVSKQRMGFHKVDHVHSEEGGS